MQIKRGTRRKPALRNSRENAAFNLVRGILRNNRNNFETYLNERIRNYTIKNNGVFKGFAFLEKHKTDPSALVLTLIATTSEPGKGYGRALMQRIVDDVRRKGYKRLVIHDPLPGVRNFYKKFNAKITPKARKANTTLMQVNFNNNSAGEVTSRRRSPSRQSPARPSSSPRSSPRRSARRQTPRS
jgi:hypothetical protein